MKPSVKIFLVAIIILLGVAQGGLILSHVFSDKKNDLGLGEKVLVVTEEISIHNSYFSSRGFFDEAYRDGEGRIKFASDFIYGGVVPHHLFVKDKIAAWFSGLKNFNYETIVLVGPNHFEAGKNNIIFSAAQWQTPYGVIEPDLNLAKKLAGAGLADEESPFNFEHSISGLVSFIKKDFPRVKILPLILKSKTTEKEAKKLADILYNSVDPQKTLVIASADFSHYQPVKVADFHDEKSAAVIENFDLDALSGLEVDSPMSIYALLKYLQSVGAEKSDLIYQTNSGRLVGNFDSPTTSHQFYYFSRGRKTVEPVLSALFFGDAMIDRNVGARIKEHGFDWLLAEIKGGENRFFIGLDLISANLEGAVTDKGDHYAPKMAYDFAFAPEMVSGFKKYNFNFFNIANNHLIDQGIKGVEETKNNLDKLGLDFSGCADGAADSVCAGKIVEAGRKKVGLVGLSMVYNNFDLEKARKIVSDLKKEADLVIINIHWGNEYEHQFNKYQQNIGHALIDAGADAIIGHHPHVVQGLEIYQGKPIFYSLGNFLFDQYFSADNQEGLAVGLNISDSKTAIYFLPFKSVQSQPKLLQGQEKKDFFAKFTKWSKIDKIYSEQIKEGEIKLSGP